MPLPEPDAFATSLLAIARSMPEGGGYRFQPAERASGSPVNPRDPHHDGTTRDLSIGAHRFARTAGTGETYCCGVTLEAFWRAWTAWASEHGHAAALPQGSEADHDTLVATWFCPTMGHAGAAAAVVEHGLGASVIPEEARAGDLCQFWRSTDLERPSGHSVVFLGWEERPDGRWIRYWSSQPATNGIGEHAERVGPGWTFAFARVGLETR